MRIDDAIEIKKPEPDSQFRLKNCPVCSGDDVAYVLHVSEGKELWKAMCFGCGYSAGRAVIRHDTQKIWNGIMGQCAICAG